MIICAVDPGLSGALAWYDTDMPTQIVVRDMPVVDRDINPAALSLMLRHCTPAFAVVERVASRPGQGAPSTFKFGCGYGMIQGVIAAHGISIRLVTPQTWKKHFRLSSDKEQSRALAIKFWPTSPDFHLKRHEGRAEAALIARYAAETMR